LGRDRWLRLYDKRASVDDIDRLLDRPLSERLREHRYRCAQAVVFGAPVIALEWIGPALGGRESVRWIGFFQALLAGWAVYVGAAGMLSEGIVRWWRRGKFSGDLVAASVVVGLYGVSLLSLVYLLLTGRGSHRPLWFHWSVLALIVWTGIRWWVLARRAAREPTIPS